MLAGWFPFYRTSVALGARSLARRKVSREALIRILVPLEDSRFIELPRVVAGLGVAPGQRVLDLASPKLAAVVLAKNGARVTSVDLLESEVETWRQLTTHVKGLDFQVADGTRLPFDDESFDHAYSISAIEHIGDDGDFTAVSELARVVKPGGRIILTVPYDRAYHEEWRDSPVYGEQGTQDAGRWFFQRVYDDQRIDRLVERTPMVSALQKENLSVNSSRLYRFYSRAAPASLPLGPLVALTQHTVAGMPGLMLLTLLRLESGDDAPGTA